MAGLVLLCACAGTRGERAATAAMPAGMAAVTIPASPFLLTAYQRIGAPGQAADVYIEGDGLAWVSRGEKSLDPTPTDPVALRLAAADPAANVIYLARPCQYSKMLDPATPCSDEYWSGRRFAPEVIAAMGAAFDTLKAGGRVSGYHLVGYSGGGAVAALLAARRGDVLSLRTVAGNLDHETLNRVHGVSPMPGSLNPRDAAPALSAMPQLHFLGADDKVVMPEVLESFHRAMGASTCYHASTVPGVTHEKGWTEAWPGLLAMPVKCD